MLYAICISAITGLIVWYFLKIMNISIEFIWETLPNIIRAPFYTIIVCTLGGLLLGIAGTFLTYTMFSGEHQIEKIIGNMKN